MSCRLQWRSGTRAGLAGLQWKRTRLNSLLALGGLVDRLARAKRWICEGEAEAQEEEDDEDDDEGDEEDEDDDEEE